MAAKGRAIRSSPHGSSEGLENAVLRRRGRGRRVHPEKDPPNLRRPQPAINDPWLLQGLPGPRSGGANLSRQRAWRSKPVRPIWGEGRRRTQSRLPGCCPAEPCNTCQPGSTIWDPGTSKKVAKASCSSNTAFKDEDPLPCDLSLKQLVGRGTDI